MSNVPRLRFSEFEGDWQTKKLNYLVTSIDSGWSPDCDSRPANLNEWGVLKTTSTTWNGYDEEENKKLPDSLVPRPNIEVQENDILITRAGPVNRVGVVAFVSSTRPMLMLSDKLIRLRSNEEVHPPFLFRSISGVEVQKYLAARKSGLAEAQANISQDILRKAPVKIPPTKLEQQKIAAFLTAVDTKIEQLTKKEQLLKQYKKGVMQKIFSQEIRFKADDGSDFPEWEMRSLGTVFREVTERVGSQDVETYSISAGKGFVSQKEKFGRDISGQQNEKYTVLRPNQFSYNKGNSKTYTYGCVYPNTLGHPIALPNVFISFSLKDSNNSVTFYAKLFEHHYLDRSLRRIISSSARMDGLLNISKVDFFKIRLPVPSYPEQQKAGEFLKELDVKLAHAQQQLESAKNFKKGLLQQMFV